MAEHSPLQSGSEQQVTASDLVRHFGIWQDRATRAPVYILHRGRPRLVLTSLDVMDALCAPHASETSDAGQLRTLLDAMEDMIVILAPDGSIAEASRGARSYFGDLVHGGSALSNLAAPGDDALLAAVARVTASGLSETVECRSPRFADRLLAYAIDCAPNGCVMQIEDATAAEELQQWRDRHESVTHALEAAGAATAIINLRGRIEQASHRLATMTGASLDALHLARIVSLVAVGDRTTLGDAFEAVIDRRAAQSLQAALLVGGAALQPVSIGLAPLMSAGHVIGVTVIIAPAAA